jgi:hypothetical protein
LHCRSTQNRGYGFHYCSLSNAGTQKSVNVLGSILAQAVEVKPEIIEWVRPLRKQDYHLITQNTLSLQELLETLQKSIDLFNEFFILIDALNETPDQGEIVSTLLELVTVSPKLRVLVTCTTNADPSIDDGSLIMTQQMVAPMVDHDIASYVHYRMQSEVAFSSLTKRTQDEIKKAIRSTANGM